MLSYEIVDLGVNLSDHWPIRLCTCCTQGSVSVPDGSNKGNRDHYPHVKQLRWDHANLPAYRETTGLYLKELHAEITALEKRDAVSVSHIADLSDTRK